MSNQTETQLKARRKVLKSQLTRTKTYISRLSPTAPVDELKERLNHIMRSYSEFDDIQTKLEELETPEEEESQEDEEEVTHPKRQEFDELYYHVVGLARNRVRASEAALSTVGSAHDPSTTSRDQPSTGPPRQIIPSHNSAVHLPKMTIPTFDGDYQQWQSFHDLFKSIVHDHPGVTDVIKLYHLRSALTGEAAKIIQALELTDNNYEVAWKLVCERYQKKRLLVQQHTRAFLRLQSLQRESHTDLRSLIDEARRHIEALRALKEPVQHWDTMLIQVLIEKLDKTSIREWEMRSKDDEVPTLKDLLDFLSHRCGALEAVYRPISGYQAKTHQPATVGERGGTFNRSSKGPSTRAHANVAHSSNCYKCGKPHPLYSCSEFKALDVKQRVGESHRLGLCLNCLKKAHPGSECKGSCRVCFQAHNTLLHSDEKTLGITAQPGVTKSISNAAVVMSLSSRSEYGALLASAIICILDRHGRHHTCRALLDSGSTSNFMTTELCNKLQLTTHKQSISIDGIGGTHTQGAYYTRTTISSRFNEYSASLCFIVMDRVTGSLPALSKSDVPWKVPAHLRLADPDYHLGGQVDMIIGIGLFWDLLCVGQIKLGRGLPVLQKTKLGWIIAGDLGSVSNMKRGMCSVGFSELNSQIEKFWYLEENVDHPPAWSAEEALCEDLFRKSVFQGDDGKFVVSMPLREQVNQLGDSFHVAYKRLEAMERRFRKDPTLKEAYISFMKEYQALGHMTPIIDEPLEEKRIKYYLPHHAVLRPDSATTKLRVVFDGSAASSSGKSLNDLLLVGPTIQEDLLSLILRFRCHRIVITADIEKMYRQVWIHPSQRDLQCVLWRDDPDQSPTTFQLNTITYGTSSAPFLAIRCLKKIADETRDSNPLASQIIENDFYVDDMITGADTLQDALELCKEVSSVLKARGFILRKWCSNDKQIVQDHQDQSSNRSSSVDLGGSEESKTLGVRWHSSADSLQYIIKINVKSRKISKRSILSETAQIFDPLGLLAPVVILAKITMQELWQLKLGWDEAVPMSIHTQWERFRVTLSELNEIKIPRRVIDGDGSDVQLHGFADASEKAYGSCIYVRTKNQEGNVTIRLLCAKSRVAPLKQKTLPSLELCAAVLLAELYHKVKTSLKMETSTYFWTDSELVLAWLADEPRRWTTFIGNRVSKIQQLTNVQEWRHVPGISNPADLVSRGVLPGDLIENQKWWNGPEWLQLDPVHWPKKIQVLQEVPGLRRSALCHIGVERCSSVNLFSDLEQMLQTTGVCFRAYKLFTQKDPPISGRSLSTDELQHALRTWIEISQREKFRDELKCLKMKRQLDRKSQLLPLNPYIDEEGLLRVGGRLENSDQTYDQKHPLILSPQHRVTELIIKAEHDRLLHAGPQSVFANLRLRYWIVQGRNVVKRIVRQCDSCARFNAISVIPQMGNLPADRTRICRPFTNAGVDYAGPVYIKLGNRRSQTKMKGYIALFVCFSTKAIHLELVTALTTEAFLSALKRFMARRGRVSNLYSDNGTNFVGAARQLQDLTQTLQSAELSDVLCGEGIRWHFIPPRSPHFGGLWEAGVRSVKNHLKRVLGEAFLTFEEYCTVLSQIEACLNSRPITYISTDADDPLPLTPGHFLIGEPLMALPEANVSEVPDNRLRSWEKLQKMKQHFWKRWAKEYLSSLQERAKWSRGSSASLNVGDIVLLKDNQLQPLQWTVGRVSALHPGKDEVARVATVSTAKGETTRAITQLCLLPCEGNLSNKVNLQV